MDFSYEKYLMLVPPHGTTVAMPRHGQPAQPRVILAYDRHGDVVESDMVELVNLRNLPRRPARPAPAQLPIKDLR